MPPVFRLQGVFFAKRNIYRNDYAQSRLSFADIAINGTFSLEKIGASADAIVLASMDKSPYNKYQQIPIEWNDR